MLLKNDCLIQNAILPLTAWSGYSVEPVAQVVFITVVAVGAEVKIIALGTFEPDAENWLLPTGITHGAVMFHPCKDKRITKCLSLVCKRLKTLNFHPASAS